MSEQTDVARARELLKERARALSRPIKTIAQSLSRGIVVFNLGDERYAIETRYVHTVQRLPRITPLPGTSAHVLGLAPAYGELLVVFELRALLGTARPAYSDSSRMLVLGEQNAELAIVADAVHDVEQLQDAEVFELPAATTAEIRPYLRGVTDRGISIFDAAALLENPQLYVDDPSLTPAP